MNLILPTAQWAVYLLPGGITVVGHKYSIMMFYRYWPELVFVVVFRFFVEAFSL